MEESFNPTIGKTVLETLTSGMYDDARFIFREYIQNAVDQIDQAVQLGILTSKSDGKVEIEIDVEQKRIVSTIECALPGCGRAPHRFVG